jgi:hypothetical protein
MKRAWVVLAAVLAAEGSVQAAQSIFQGERAGLSLGGYAYTLGGLQQLDFAYDGGPLDPPPPPHHLGLSATVLRFEWKADLGTHVNIEIHQRLFSRVSSESLDGAKLGLGASAVPGRTVDLRSVAYDEERLLLEHDLDRLAVRAGLGDVDLTLGRQAITWGFAALLPIADLWTTFSPFELDTSQKRGVDALRIIYSHSPALEFEGVVADRGSLRDLSGGMRAVAYLSVADVYLSFAKQWRELIASAGAALVVGSFRLHAEAAGPYDLDARELSRPRGSMGLDWFRPKLTITLEGQYNGTGVAHAADYVAHLTTSPIVARGESYLLGRWYAGASAAWRMSELFQFTGTVLGNLQDPSVVFATSLTYQISQETALSLGAFRGVGRTPRFGAVPELRSEFGAVGGLYYLSLSAFF